MPKKILAVDDEPSLRELYRRAFSEQGYQITLAATAGEARALMSGNSYDLIITDLVLPDGAGTELTDLAAAAGNGTHSILVSGAVEPWEMPIFSEKYGLKGFFPKPFRVAALVSLVKDLLG